MTEAIGGYFGLELNQNNNTNPHSNAYAVNSGRNALHCILETLKPVKVLIPKLLCEVILEPLKKLDIAYEFYSITESFRPEIGHLDPGTFLLYINYFGVCDSVVKELTELYSNQIIIDNTQAFFSEPIPGIPTFYSARKFFGVPDGAYFYGVDYDLLKLPQGTSWNRCSHLLKRIDLSPEEGYQDFVSNDKLVSGLKPARMSKLTEALLASVDYKSVKQKRIDNYQYMHTTLKQTNLITEFLPNSVPAISYPYLTQNGEHLRQLLIKEKIFVPKFWPEIEVTIEVGTNEDLYSNKIVHFPIDHRYSSSSLDFFLSSFSQYL